MKLICYRSASGPRVAGVREGECVDLANTDPSLPSCVKRLLAEWTELRPKAEAALAAGEPLELEQIELLPAIPSPEKIICIGLNYADHARETNAPMPSEPVVFNKFPSAVCGQWQPILLPRASQQVDYEAELVVVIGRGGRRIPVQEAREHIAAYCCGNDISARDWQLGKPGGQWLLGKSFDTFAPIGPALVTADEIPDPNNLAIRLRLNGQVMQDSSTAQLIFKLEELVAYVSGVCTLSPGDLIFTGTPGGVGFTRRPPVFLKPGDTVEVEIQKIGILRNPVRAEPEPAA